MAGKCAEEWATLRRLQDAYLRKRKEFNDVKPPPPAAPHLADAPEHGASDVSGERMRADLRLSRELRQIQDQVLKAKTALDKCLGRGDRAN